MLKLNSHGSKINSLREIIHQNPLDILCIDETKLDESFPDRQFQLRLSISAFSQRQELKRGCKMIFSEKT